MDQLKQIKHHLLASKAMEEANLRREKKATNPREIERFHSAAEANYKEAEELTRQLSELEGKQDEQYDRDSARMANERAMTPEEAKRASKAASSPEPTV